MRVLKKTIEFFQTNSENKWHSIRTETEKNYGGRYIKTLKYPEKGNCIHMSNFYFVFMMNFISPLIEFIRR